MDFSDRSVINYIDLELNPTHCGYCGGNGSLTQVRTMKEMKT